MEELADINQFEKDKPGRIWSGIEIATQRNVWIMQSEFGQGKALYIFRDDDKTNDGKAHILQRVPTPNDNAAFDQCIEHMKNIAEMICPGAVEDSPQARRAARDSLVPPHFVKRAAQEEDVPNTKRQKQPTPIPSTGQDEQKDDSRTDEPASGADEDSYEQVSEADNDSDDDIGDDLDHNMKALLT